MRLLVPALAAHSAVKNAQLPTCGEQWLALPFRWSSTGGRGQLRRRDLASCMGGGLHGPGEQAMGMGMDMGMDMDMDMHGCAWQQKTGGGGAVVPG
jgi:hypothetical protein